jgi:hypothetical protein
MSVHPSAHLELPGFPLARFQSEVGRNQDGRMVDDTVYPVEVLGSKNTKS